MFEVAIVYPNCYRENYNLIWTEDKFIIIMQFQISLEAIS